MLSAVSLQKLTVKNKWSVASRRKIKKINEGIAMMGLSTKEERLSLIRQHRMEQGTRQEGFKETKESSHTSKFLYCRNVVRWCKSAYCRYRSMYWSICFPSSALKMGVTLITSPSLTSVCQN